MTNNDNSCIRCQQIAYGYLCGHCLRNVCRACVVKVKLVGDKAVCVCKDCISAEEMLEKIRPNG